MEEWKEYKLEELIDEISMGPFGSNIKVECFTDSGVPVLNGSNLVGIKLNEDKFNYVTEEKATSLGKANAYRNDIVITHRGTLGQIVYIPENSKYDHYVISQSQFRVKCNDKVLPQYIVYYFHSRIGQYQLLSNASQVGVPALARPTTTFQKLTVNIPPLPTQQKIVSILSSLDDKIELNNKINENLEQQAQALFDELFPNVIDDNGLNKMEELITFSNGKKRPEESGTIPVFGGNGILAYTNKSNNENCIIIGRVGAYCGNVFLSLNDCWISDNAISAKSKETNSQFFVFYLLKKANLQTRHIGSGQPLLTQGILNSISINIPQRQKVEQFNDLLKPIYEQIFCNSKQNENLISIRDTLLPKLMNGEIEV